MNYLRIKYIFLLLCSITVMSAQSLSQAEKWFRNGDFEKAKPVYRKLVRQSPSVSNYNYKYGACCFETGEVVESLPYLEKSAKRKVINAYFYLSKAYYEMYRFDEAIQNLEEYIYWLEKKNRDVSHTEAQMNRYRLGARMVRGVEKITIVDSVVVDKDSFLDAFMLSEESGKLDIVDNTSCVSYTNQMGDKKLLSQMNKEGKRKLYSSLKLSDSWMTPSPISVLNESADELNYPFVDSDGITIYYGAKGNESLGGYDIFITRYNTDDNTYFKPDNVGMPFNSPYNDYMYAIDDYRNLGWFASDRYQPEGKVCVYVFIPNESKEVYDYENIDHKLLAKYARLSDIKLTWKDSQTLKRAQHRLAEVHNSTRKGNNVSELRIVINDKTIYDSLKDFKSKEAAMQYQDYRRKQQDLDKMSEQIEELRKVYKSADKKKQDNMRLGILDKEKRIKELYDEIELLVKNLRILENIALKKK